MAAESYAVIFSSQLSEDLQGYAAMAERMLELAQQQPGFLHADSARDAAGFGITVSYWASLEAITTWRQNIEHLAAQSLGRERWYAQFSLRIAKVEREYQHTKAAL